MAALPARTGAGPRRAARPQHGIGRLFDHWDSRARSARGRRTRPADAYSGRRLAPLLYPGKILFRTANYYEHLAEMGMPGAKKANQRLFFFFKPPRNAVVGEGDTVRMPLGTKAFDWEVELAAVIGRALATCRPKKRSPMWPPTLSASIFRRGTTTARRRPSTSSTGWREGAGHVLPARPAPGAGEVRRRPAGPRAQALVNGEVKQDARTSGMIFDMREQLVIALGHHDARPGRRGADRHAAPGSACRRRLSAGRRPGRRRDRSIGKLSVGKSGRHYDQRRC